MWRRYMFVICFHYQRFSCDKWLKVFVGNCFERVTWCDGGSCEWHICRRVCKCIFMEWNIQVDSKSNWQIHQKILFYIDFIWRGTSKNKPNKCGEKYSSLFKTRVASSDWLNLILPVFLKHWTLHQSFHVHHFLYAETPQPEVER